MFVWCVDQALEVIRQHGTDDERLYFERTGIKMGTQCGIEMTNEGLSEPILMVFGAKHQLTGDLLFNRTDGILESNKHIDFQKMNDIQICRRTGEGLILQEEMNIIE
jgi:hypothetical protein